MSGQVAGFLQQVGEVIYISSLGVSSIGVDFFIRFVVSEQRGVKTEESPLCLRKTMAFSSEPPFYQPLFQLNIDGFVKSPTSALRCIPCPVKLKAAISAISRDMGYRSCLKTVTSNKENI
jgi:hypothetical protein